MTGPDQRSALSALEAARPTLARLDPARHAEENAADLLEVWSAIETALRSLVGGSVLAGQPLIRELRQREIISLEQAHAVLEMLAVRERVERTDYQPTAGDMTVAREAFEALERGLRAPTAAGGAGGAGAATATAPPPAPAESYSYMPPPDTGRRGPGLAILAALIAVLLVAGGIYYFFTSRSGIPSEVAAGIAEYGAGRPEAARAALERAVRDHPTLALPHIYLARIAREDGDFARAGTELKTALELEPQNAVALRELGSFFLARGTQFANQNRPDLAQTDYDAARRNYAASLQLDPTDRTAQGFLGCTMMRLGRTEEAQRWLERAGDGPWSACASSPRSGTPPAS